MTHKLPYKIGFLLFSILIIWIAFDSAVLIHEWTHGFVAWINGVKASPFDIYYGDWTLLNVDEAVDYKSLIDAGRNWAVACIAISPIIVNLFLSLYCFHLMKKNEIKIKKWIYAFCFWFSAFNLAEFFSYVPIRTFTTHADVFNFNHALDSSPWIIGLLGGFVSLILIAYFFLKILPETYSVLNINNLWIRIIYLLATLFIFFVIGGYRGASNYGVVSAIMGKVSLAMIPVIFVFCFPSRGWIQAVSYKSNQK